MKAKITFISVVTLSIALLLTSCSGKETVSTTEHRIPRLKTARHLRTIPTRNWMIYISRRTGSLQSIKIYGTNYLV